MIAAATSSTCVAATGREFYLQNEIVTETQRRREREM